MYHKVFDYYTVAKRRMEAIEEELASRTPEGVASDQEAALASFEEIMRKYKTSALSYRRVANQKKYTDFLLFAEKMRKYTALHEGKISISAEEGGLGNIEMFFDCIIHTEFDYIQSRSLIAQLFLIYKDVFITAQQGGIAIQVLECLYDEEGLEA